MPIDLSRLRAPLPPLRKPGLDASDERLSTLDSLAQTDRFDAVAPLVGELFDAGLYDIRPISYLLYAAFDDGGFRGLADVLEVTAELVGPGIESLGPERRREDHINKRLGWLFDRVANALEYHDKHQSPRWTLWRATLSPDVIKRALDAGARVSDLLSSMVYTRAVTSLGQVMSRLRVQESALAAAAPAPVDATPAADEKAPARPAAAPPKGPSAESPAPAPRREEPPPQPHLTRVELWAAPPFVELRRKLAAFEALIEKGHFEKAAIVLEDISSLVEGFDPRVYFPDLFARHAALTAKHVRSLLEHQEEKGPIQIALLQHYRVDLDGFVEG